MKGKNMILVALVFKLHCFVLSNIDDYSIHVKLQYQLSRLR